MAVYSIENKDDWFLVSMFQLETYMYSTKSIGVAMSINDNASVKGTLMFNEFTSTGTN